MRTRRSRWLGRYGVLAWIVVTMGAAGVAGWTVVGGIPDATAQGGHGQHSMQMPPGSQAPEQKAEPDGHGGPHGTPENWTFRLPAGNPRAGREALVKFECFKCHEVKGERFPAPTEAGKVGPELAQMGPMHPAEYFAESIINPNAAIEKGKGYEAPDGSSKMPSSNDFMTVQELVDLVAYLKSLKPPQGQAGGAGGPGSVGQMQHPQ